MIAEPLDCDRAAAVGDESLPPKVSLVPQVFWLEDDEVVIGPPIVKDDVCERYLKRLRPPPPPKVPPDLSPRFIDAQEDGPHDPTIIKEFACALPIGIERSIAGPRGTPSLRSKWHDPSPLAGHV
jgi:hypothetical protein